MINFTKKQPFINESRQIGFSLAEMSVVMVIIGFIASSAISVAISSDYVTKKKETEAKMLQIDTALAGFVAINHRLPCPADGTTLINANGFGLEQSSGTPAICTKNFNVVIPSTTFSVWGGVVPVTTLQLPNDFMFDGWGNRIDYIVDGRFTIADTSAGATCDASSSASDNCFRDVTDGSITVKDAAQANRTQNAVYVTLSHGANGHGAFPKTGSATSSRINGFPVGNPYRDATASADEFTNAKVNNSGATTTPYQATFVMRDFTRNDDKTAATNARTYFDDQLHFSTKQQIVKAAGANIYEAICYTALNIINHPGSNDCTGAKDPTQCQTFATDVNSRCLQ